MWAIDNDPWAVATYRRNIGHQIIEADIREEPVPRVPCDILLAAPPCQDFSTLWNHDGAKTARGNLFRQVSRYLIALRPAAFVLENVPGLLSANRGAAWTIVRHALRAPASFLGMGAGPRYDISAEVIDLADLGVPQNRPRLIVIGFRRDLCIRPASIPRPYRGKHRSVGWALDREPIAPDAPNHERGLDSSEVVERLKLIPAGKNYEVIPEGHPLSVRGLISHVYRRLDPDKPAYTVISGGGGGTHGYHHIEPRRLSNREKARLQTFPDSFVFEGGKMPSAYPRVRRQVGNAVPPLAAKIIVRTIARQLAESGIQPKGYAAADPAARERWTTAALL